VERGGRLCWSSVDKEGVGGGRGEIGMNSFFSPFCVLFSVLIPAQCFIYLLGVSFLD
jgi:hypothetical protein